MPSRDDDDDDEVVVDDWNARAPMAHAMMAGVAALAEHETAAEATGSAGARKRRKANMAGAGGVSLSESMIFR